MRSLYEKFCRDCVRRGPLLLWGLLPLLCCLIPLLLGLLNVPAMMSVFNTLGLGAPAAVAPVPVAQVTVVPPTVAPPTAVPPTAVPPTAVPPTAAPTAVPPTLAPTAVPRPTEVPFLFPAIASIKDGAKLNPAADAKSCVVTGTAKPGAKLIINDYLPESIVKLGEVVADAAGAWSFDACKLAPGAHRLAAVHVDDKGAVLSASLPVGFEVGGAAAAATVAPTATPAPAAATVAPTRAPATPAPTTAPATATPAPAAAPATGTTLSQAAGSTIAAGSALRGRCVPNAMVDVFADGKLIATVPCSAAGEWTLNLPLSLGVGEHTFQAVSVDKDKKKLSESAPVKVTVVAPLPVTGGEGQ